MAGRIYITGDGADPFLGTPLNDPLFGSPPTLGACMPNIRRAVKLGDYIFVVSAKLPNVQQLVVGGFRVEEKISALQAYARFPEYRIRMGNDGHLKGNIIVDAEGIQHRLDRHNPRTLAARVENYIVGSGAVALQTEEEIALGRAESLTKVSKVLGKPIGNRMVDVIGRASKLSDEQAENLYSWLKDIKSRA